MTSTSASEFMMPSIATTKNGCRSIALTFVGRGPVFLVTDRPINRLLGQPCPREDGSRVIDCLAGMRGLNTSELDRDHPLTPQDAEPSAELSPKKPDSKNPPVKNPREKEENAREGAQASPVIANIACEQEGRTPFPDDALELTAEEEAEIWRAGHDPAELRNEVREWANRTGATSPYWPRAMINWARRTPPKRRRSQQRTAADKPTAKQDRTLQVMAGWRAAMGQWREEARA